MFRKFWVEHFSLERGARTNILKMLVANGKDYGVSTEDIELLKQWLDDDIV